MATLCQQTQRWALWRTSFTETQNISPILNCISRSDSLRAIAEDVILMPTSRLAPDPAIASVSYINTVFKWCISNDVQLFSSREGQKFALMEEKIILSSIFRNFHVKALDKREELILLIELILRPRDGIRLRLTSKQKS